MQLQEVQALLLQGRFEEPAAHFQALHADFENGRIGEPQYLQAVRAASVERRAAEPAFEAWVRAFPDDYFARYAAGNFYVRLGWRARSTATSQFTTETQFSTMNAYFEKALPHLYRALELSPKPFCTIAVGLMLETAGGIDLPRSFLALSDAYVEQSVDVCATRMWALQPKWGGSDEELEAFHTRISRLPWSAEAADYLDERHVRLRAESLCCDGRLDEAAAMLQHSRHAGSPGMQHSLGIYRQNQERHAEAVECLRAAAQDHAAPDTLDRLGNSLAALGRDAEADAAYAQAAELGDGDAAGRMAYRLRAGMDDPRTAAEAVRWCTLGTEQYSGYAMFERGCHLLLGLGTPKRPRDAVPHWEQAMAWGSVSAIWNAVAAYWEGRFGTPKDHVKARRYAAQGALMDCVDSTSVYGVMLYRGQGGPRDYEQAIEHLHTAACRDDLLAMRYLARALWYGHGAPVDRPGAREWLDRLRQLDGDSAKDVRAELFGVTGWLRSGWNQWRQRSAGRRA